MAEAFIKLSYELESRGIMETNEIIAARIAELNDTFIDTDSLVAAVLDKYYN